jgi:hypothetical protein
LRISLSFVPVGILALPSTDSLSTKANYHQPRSSSNELLHHQYLSARSAAWATISSNKGRKVPLSCVVDVVLMFECHD